VQVRIETPVTAIDENGVDAGGERIEARTVLWAAGVQASRLGKALPTELDSKGRVPVNSDLSLLGHPQVFVIGDQALAKDEKGNPLPGVATVALQGFFIFGEIPTLWTFLGSAVIIAATLYIALRESRARAPAAAAAPAAAE
jgi:NADH dehydrogenase